MKMLNMLGAAISGVLVSLAVHSPWLWWLGILGLIPFISALRNSKKPYWVGFMFGTVLTAGTLFEYWTVLPLSARGIENPLLGVVLVFSHWGSIALTFGALFGIGTVVYVRFASDTIWQRSLFAASLITLIQYGQMWVFSILMLGETSLIEPHFSAAMLGYTMAGFSPFLQLASLGGVYALTWVAIFVAFMLFEVIRTYAHSPTHRMVRYAVFLGVCGILTLLDQSELLSVRNEPHEKSVRVALVTTQASPTWGTGQEWREYNQSINQMTRKWAQTHVPPDILLFPEGTGFFDSIQENPVSFAREVFKSYPVTIIDTSITSATSTHVQFFAYGPDEHTYVSKKRFLAPGGEYQPLFMQLPFKTFFAQSALASKFDAQPHLSPGNVVPIPIASTTVGALFCSEIHSPRLYRELTADGAEILFNAASYASYHSARMIGRHTITIAKVRAVENGRYLAIAQDNGSSVIISDRGAVIAKSEIGTNILAGEVPLLSKRTFYTTYGEGVLIAPALVVVLCAWMHSIRERRRRDIVLETLRKNDPVPAS